MYMIDYWSYDINKIIPEYLLPLKIKTNRNEEMTVIPNSTSSCTEIILHYMDVSYIISSVKKTKELETIE